MIFKRAIATVALLVVANVALADGVIKGDAAAGDLAVHQRHDLFVHEH